jgi:hypothetical protein
MVEHVLFWGGVITPENISDKIAKIGETAQEYKNAVVEKFKDMDVEVKQWNFNVGKEGEGYNVEVVLKLGIKSKKK